MTTLQVLPELILIRNDNSDILVIGTELISFGVIPQGVMRWRRIAIVILFRLVRETHGGENVIRTGEDLVTLRRSEYVKNRRRLERRAAIKERRPRCRAQVKDARCARDAVIYSRRELAARQSVAGIWWLHSRTGTEPIFAHKSLCQALSHGVHHLIGIVHAPS